MPWPPNMRRTLTRRIGAKRSCRSSSVMAGSVRRRRLAAAPAFGSRYERNRFPAAAGRDLVRVVEHELGRELGRAEIHLGAEQEQHGLGVDQHGDALLLHDLVARPDGLGGIERVG